jgi:hemerythrin superfamily protein
MNIIDMLKADHRKVQELFHQYEAAGGRSTQQQRGIAEQIFTELEVHSTLEEEIFYPAVRTKLDQEGQELVDDSLEDHQTVKALITELRALNPNDEQFATKLEELRENVEEHVGEEEDEMFPEAQEALGNELDRLSTQAQDRKEKLMASEP